MELLDNEFEELKNLSGKLTDCLPMIRDDDLEPGWYHQLVLRLEVLVKTIERRRNP